MTKQEPINMLLFKNRADWRTRLENNHAHQTEAWLIHYKKPYDKESVNHFEAVEEAICYGWIDSQLKKLDDRRFILHYTPRKPNSVWSKINKDTAERMINQGKMTQAGLITIQHAKRCGHWDAAYTNTNKDRLPTDLKQVLQKDTTAWTNFQAFANTYRNMYIGWITTAKTKTTRQKRIAEVVNRAHHNKKPGID